MYLPAQENKNTWLCFNQTNVNLTHTRQTLIGPSFAKSQNCTNIRLFFAATSFLNWLVQTPVPELTLFRTATLPHFPLVLQNHRLRPPSAFALPINKALVISLLRQPLWFLPQRFLYLFTGNKSNKAIRAILSVVVYTRLIYRKKPSERALILSIFSLYHTILLILFWSHSLDSNANS